jgi:hypothetical protein
MSYGQKIAEFTDYVLVFYHEQYGIYPIASKQAIVQAIDQYLESKPLKDIHFDSLDRESVRMILQPDYVIFLN